MTQVLRDSVTNGESGNQTTIGNMTKGLIQNQSNVSEKIPEGTRG